MNVIALLICLGLDRFTPIANKLRCYAWVNLYCKFLDKQINQRWQLSDWLAIAILVLPIVFVTLLVQWLLMLPLYGILGFLFNLVVLLYCLGTTKVHRYAKDDQSKPLETLFLQSQQQLFSILFWFVIFGAVGALVYRMLLKMNRCYVDQNATELTTRLTTVQQYLDWIPVRLVAFIFALVGDFSQTFLPWLRYSWSSPSQNEEVLLNCGFAALAIPEGSSVETVAEYQPQAVGLIERALLATLVILILIVLTAWVQWQW